MNHVNFVTLATLTSVDATDNAYGKVRTVALAPNFSTVEDALDAMRVGRTILTDGPMLTFGIDLSEDGTIDQVGEDVQVGEPHVHSTAEDLTFTFKWQTTPEFGPIKKLRLLRGARTTGSAPEAYEVLQDLDGLGTCAGTSRFAGSCTVTLELGGKLEPPRDGERVYYRAVAYSETYDEFLGDTESYRAITNPIWVFGRNPENLSHCSSAGAFKQPDRDRDGVEDACDNCPFVSNPDQDDPANVGIGSACLHYYCVSGSQPECAGPREPHAMTDVVMLEFETFSVRTPAR